MLNISEILLKKKQTPHGGTIPLKLQDSQFSIVEAKASLKFSFQKFIFYEMRSSCVTINKVLSVPHGAFEMFQRPGFFI